MEEEAFKQATENAKIIVSGISGFVPSEVGMRVRRDQYSYNPANQNFYYSSELYYVNADEPHAWSRCEIVSWWVDNPEP